MKLKFCGLSTLNSLKHACDLGAHYAGFIFADRSPRKVNQEFMDQLASFNFHQTIPVCVFVNPSAVFVEQVIASLPTAILQFHGDESLDFCESFGLDFWKVIRVKDKNDLDLMQDYPTASAILLENHKPGIYGGTGETFNWDILDSMPELDNNIVLSGGINLENVHKSAANNWLIEDSKWFQVSATHLKQSFKDVTARIEVLEKAAKRLQNNEIDYKTYDQLYHHHRFLHCLH